jgi:hypothetical protein
VLVVEQASASGGASSASGVQAVLVVEQALLVVEQAVSSGGASSASGPFLADFKSTEFAHRPGGSIGYFELLGARSWDAVCWTNVAI